MKTPKNLHTVWILAAIAFILNDYLLRGEDEATAQGTDLPARGARADTARVQTVVGQVTNILVKAKKADPTVFTLRFFADATAQDSIVTLTAPTSLGKVEMLDLYLVQFETDGQVNQVKKLEKCDWRRIRVSESGVDSNLAVWHYRDNSNESHIARVFLKKTKR